MNDIFDWCVEALKFWAAQFGITYEEINVWLFVIILPSLVLIQWVIIFLLIRKLRKTKFNIVK